MIGPKRKPLASSPTITLTSPVEPAFLKGRENINQSLSLYFMVQGKNDKISNYVKTCSNYLNDFDNYFNLITFILV
jgi:hypothetical protein